MGRNWGTISSIWVKCSIGQCGRIGWLGVAAKQEEGERRKKPTKFVS